MEFFRMRTFRMVSLALLWGACSGDAEPDPDGKGNTDDLECDEGEPQAFWPDADGDGYGDASATEILACGPQPGTVDNDLDCDDTRPDVNPDQQEDCSVVDRNCDGSATSGGTQLVYYDGDGDGFGDTSKPYTLCDAGANYVLIDGDCDDGDPDVYPGAEERCNGIDDDCDFVVDNDPVDPQTLFVDADGDGYGAPGSTVVACPGPNLSDNDLDCDDSNPDIHPDAVEVCNGGIDDDCDPLTDEDTTVVWYQDLDGDGFGNDEVTFVGCEPPLDFVATGGDCDDDDAALNPVAFPDCVMTHCGTIASSETWGPTLEHLVTCDVEVKGAARPVLTIEDGTTVRFDEDTELIIADGSEGRLTVDGAVLGVTFASSALVPAYGDWGGLVIGSRDQGSSLVGLTVSHAGGNGVGGIALEGCDPVLDRVVAIHNLNDGLNVTGAGAEPLIHDSQFVDNTDHGVYIGAGAGLSRAPAGGGAGPSFEGNFVTGNAGIAISLPGSHADELAISSSYTGNGQDVIELLTGTLRFTGQWYDHGVPYVVAANQTISVEDGPQAALTIEPGVQMYFDTSAELKIGNAAGGTLTIDAVDDPVVMTGTDTVVSTGVEWDGITFGPHDLGSSIDGLILEHGGANTFGNLYVNGSAPLIANVVSRYSDNAGMYVAGDAAPEVRDSEFSDNDTDGVYVSSTSALARSALGPTFVGNALIRNRAPIVVPPNMVAQIDLDTVFEDNSRPIGIHGGDLLEDGSWHPLADGYQVFGNIDIEGPQDPELEIHAGVVMVFDRDAALSVGMFDDGALIVLGTPSEPVLMTSSASVPGEGDWEGIEIGRNGALRRQSSLSGLLIEYAGGSDTQDGGAIELHDRDVCTTPEPLVTLSDITVRRSSKGGLYTEPSVTYSVSGFAVDRALEGCFVSGTSTNPLCQTTVVAFDDVTCRNSPVFGSWPLTAAHLLAGVDDLGGAVLIDDTRVSQHVTLPALAFPYRVSGLIRVYDSGNQPTMTVAAGAEVQFDPGAGIEAGVSGPGGLVLEDGAVLTSSQIVPSPGNWLGLRLGAQCVTSELAGSVSYGGANTFGNVYLNGCAATLLPQPPLSIGALDLRYASTCGLHIGTADASVYDLSAVSFLGNVQGDLCP